MFVTKIVDREYHAKLFNFLAQSWTSKRIAKQIYQMVL